MSVAHRWSICTHCRVEMVHCGHCGNNTCNGGSGEGCPDNCKSAREFEALSEVPPELTAKKLALCAEWAAMTPEQRDAHNQKMFDASFAKELTP